ncbi:MAG TPA: glycerol-3-phosphate dehydrogenase [Candidatus Thermoplasmatota archaeon]|nr:glycerol-3-phosphate dehydrogenase [Candidatus Thermoplasmatota archaeon]
MPSTASHDPEVSLARRPQDLAGREFDLVVIGGGINGTGVARDAARRGLKVALLEKEDFGYGTTGRSTRLIHGGLRYLAMLDFGLVRESLREREMLLRNAPHLVEPLAFLVPLYKGISPGKTKLKAGLTLYDALSYDKRMPAHRFLSKDETLAEEPSLNPEGLDGALLYYDAQVPLVERLCLENALDAAAHGAVVVNHLLVLDFVREGTSIAGVRVKDRLSGREDVVRAKTVVNATGPWLNVLDVHVEDKRLRMTKGIHIVVPPVVRHAVVLFAEDGRLFFAIPWLGRTLVGTTDTDYAGDLDKVAATREEVDYLVESARRIIPGADVSGVQFTWAGVRSLLNVEGVKEGAVTRKHFVIDHAKEGVHGLFSIVGGKITPYRGVAEEVVDKVAKALKVRAACDTGKAPLPGALDPDGQAAWVAEAAAKRPGFPVASLEHLARVYGRRAGAVLALADQDPTLSSTVCAHSPTLKAEAVFAARHEAAHTLADVILRRTLLGHAPCEGRHVAPDVAALIAPVLGWDDARLSEEVAAFEAAVDLRHLHE